MAGLLQLLTKYLCYAQSLRGKREEYASHHPLHLVMLGLSTMLSVMELTCRTLEYLGTE